MPADFLHLREADLLKWSANFNSKINAGSPAPEIYGISIAQANQFDTLHRAFASAYAIANSPHTRSPSNIAAKNSAKAALKKNARMLARIIRATPEVTTTDRVQLGLAVRDPGGGGTRHGLPPKEAPLVEIVSVQSNRIRIRLRDRSSPTNVKPKNEAINGAMILFTVGNERHSPPEDLSKWSIAGQASRSNAEVVLPMSVAPGSKIWVTACWLNRRQQSGPISQPVHAYSQGGLALAA